MCLALLATGACKSNGERLLYEGRSEFNDLVVRDEGNGIRTLQFSRDGAIQSRVNVDDAMDLRLPYTRAAMLAWALVPNPERALVIGLGGGSMPTFFHRTWPRAHIDVAELDRAVLDVARKYFDLPDDERLEVHVGDGRAFVETSKEAWNLLVLDAYGDSEIPRHLATVEFLRQVKAHLRKGGVVAGNVWNRDFNALYDAMASSWAEVFGAVCIITVSGSSNRIFLATEGAPITSAQLRAAAARATQAPWLPAYAQSECNAEGWRTVPPLRD